MDRAQALSVGDPVGSDQRHHGNLDVDTSHIGNTIRGGKEMTRRVLTAGARSSEFAITLVTLLCATLLLLLDKIGADVWATAAGVSSAGYALARGLAKKA